MRLSTSRFAQTPINALPEVSLKKVKVLQIATLVSLLACSFKGYHRAVAGIYTLSALKITSDYFFAQDQMIAQIFNLIGGEKQLPGLQEVQFDSSLGVHGNVKKNQDYLVQGWSVSQLSDGRRAFFQNQTIQIDDKNISQTIVFVEKFSVLDMSSHPNITSYSSRLLLSLGIHTLAAAVLNKDTNDGHHSLSFSQAEGKTLIMTGRWGTR
ncbi:MAG: hypothetical protein KFB95_07805 [Simkaniaceae bacterium]|nr:MAG: hypothetical protein KFB95_07805 [Simkaniaceae bacterium]